MPSDALDYDEQDQSEMFDEDRINPEDSGAGPDMLTFEELPNVLDVTTALGDAEDDEALDADEIEDEDLDDLSDDIDDDEVFDDDEAEDDSLDDPLDDEPEDDEGFDDEDDDDAHDAGDDAGDLEDDEAELSYVADTDAVGGANPTRARVMESSGELSDEDLQELGYQGEEDAQ